MSLISILLYILSDMRLFQIVYVIVCTILFIAFVYSDIQKYDLQLKKKELERKKKKSNNTSE